MFFVLWGVIAAVILSMVAIAGILAYRGTERGSYSSVIPLVSMAGAIAVYAIRTLYDYFVSRGGHPGMFLPFNTDGMPDLLAWIVGFSLVLIYVNVLAALYIVPPILTCVAVGSISGHWFWRFRHRT